jgi:hypothetical protein
MQVPDAVGAVGGEAQPVEPETVETYASPLYCESVLKPLGS